MFDEKQLPDWLKGFRLENYDNAKKLTPMQWADQILFRLHIQRYLTVKNSDPTLLPGVNELLDPLFRELLEAPVSEHGYSMRSLGHVRQAAQRTVFAVSVFDLHNLLDQIELIDGRDGSDCSGPTADERLLSVDSYFSNSRVSPLADYARINVDLTAPNDEIKRDFTAWLRSARAAREAQSTPIGSPLIAKARPVMWCKDGLLAYKDIQLLELRSGCEISKELRIGLIRQNGEDFDMSSTIKRTKDRADALFTRGMAQALTYQDGWG